jgi:ABC-type sugar transport system ATPase subunit
VLQLADRIVVIREGRVADDLERGPQAARVVASALGESVENAAATALVSDSLDTPTVDERTTP